MPDVVVAQKVESNPEKFLLWIMSADMLPKGSLGPLSEMDARSELRKMGVPEERIVMHVKAARLDFDLRKYL